MSISLDIGLGVLFCFVVGGLLSCRLQLKRGLFWYGYYPNMHEMVSDWSPQAEIWTTFKLAFLFDSKNVET